MQDVQYIAVTIGNESKRLPFPVQCPICLKNSNMTVLVNKSYMETRAAFGFSAAWDTVYNVVAHCQSPVCGRLFVVVIRSSDSSALEELESVFPMKFQATSFSPEIENLSPDFVEIYAQAEHALSIDLTAVAGPGFRKATEFLVKDYAKSKVENISEEAEIIKGSVVSVIKKYVQDTRLAKAAERSFWLGNDESHYTRKWEEKDIRDLISVIKLLIHLVEMEQQFDTLLSDMPEGKK